MVYQQTLSKLSRKFQTSIHKYVLNLSFIYSTNLIEFYFLKTLTRYAQQISKKVIFKEQRMIGILVIL